MIKIFNSLTHPTLTEKWINGNYDCSIESLNQQLKGEMGACAVGIDGLENYEHQSFYNLVTKNSNFYPVAGFNPVSQSHEQNKRKELEEIKKNRLPGY